MTPPRINKPTTPKFSECDSESDDASTYLDDAQENSKESFANEDYECTTEIDNLSSGIENTSLDDGQTSRTEYQRENERTYMREISRNTRQRSKGLYPNLDPYKRPTESSPGSRVGSPNHKTSCKLQPSNTPCYRSYSYIIIITIFIFAIITISLFILCFDRSTTAITDYSTRVIHVEDIENDMKSIFLNQSQNTWLIIRSQLGHQLPRRQSQLKAHRDPVRPSTLLIVGLNNGTILRCFSRKLSGFVAQAYNRKVCTRADAEENSDSGDVAKWQMDHVVNSGYSNGDRCFYIRRLDKLSAQELLMLHAWCDGDHSPYKDSVFIFSFIIRNNETMDERAVYSYIQDKWTSLLGANEAPALLSRVANNIVIVNEEKRSDDFMSNCLT